MTALPPLNALRAFEAAARHLNFRLAAEELSVTQGAVAQQVRGLEARLRMPLFDRLPRGLALTEAGRRFHAPLRKAFRLIEGAVEDLSGDRQITISVTPSFASKWLVPRLSGFTKSHPEIAVQVDARERLADFQSDGVDIAVRQGRAPFGSGLTAVPLFSTGFVPVCSPETAARITRPADLANEPLVSALLEAGQLVRPIPDELVEDLGFYIVAPKQPRQPELVALMKNWLLSQA